MRTGNSKGTLWRYSNNLSINLSKKIKIYQNKKALQAQDKLNDSISFFSCGLFEYKKRVSFQLSVPFKASVTVEASIIIPIILFSFLEVLSLLQALSVYSGVLFAIKNVGTPISVYGYISEELAEQEEEFRIGEEVLSSLLFSEVYLDAQIQKQCEDTVFGEYIEGGAKGISLLGSYVNKKEGCISIVANYDVRPIFSFTGRRLRMRNRFYAKMWTGYRKVQEANENYVYITESGSVYHLTSDCTHLKLSISSINSREVGSLRNDYGHKYTACEKCCEGVLNTVCYITEKGDKYHEVLSCSGLKRSISCVPKDSVEGWPLCEKCSEKEGD